MTTDIKTILVPIDFSTNSDRALEYAQLLAKRFEASLHLVHVCELPGLGMAAMEAYAITYADWSRKLGEDAERELVRVIARLHGMKASTEVLFGNPARCIVTAATTNAADLIVMGTHGHGPVMHVVVGNVAERVVRTAPCPVLTVREPKAAEAEKAPWKPAAAMLAAITLVGALLAPMAAGRADAQTATPVPVDEMRQSVPGREVFRLYCAACHGTSGRGDGPLASNMRRKPADLTEIAKRNGDQFPSEMVFRTIDGRQPVRGHGGPDMPVWGDAFARSGDHATPTSVRETIESLVSYIQSFQVKPVH